jgi:hypothetical protein
MISTEEDLYTHKYKRWGLNGRRSMYPLSVPTGRSDGLTGRRSMYPLEQARTSTEETLCAHKRIDGLNERRSIYPQEVAMASPEGGVLCPQWKMHPFA